MTTAQILSKLPQLIDYVGFRFRLQFRFAYNVLSVGYYLTELKCKTPYKRKSFEAGFWTEKRVQYHLDSVGSNFLFHTTVWDDSDESLNESLKAIFERLIECRILERPVTEGVQNAEFIEVPNLYLTSNF